MTKFNINQWQGSITSKGMTYGPFWGVIASVEQAGLPWPKSVMVKTKDRAAALELSKELRKRERNGANFTIDKLEENEGFRRYC